MPQGITTEAYPQNLSLIKRNPMSLKINISVNISDDVTQLTIPITLPEINEPKGLEVALAGVSAVFNSIHALQPAQAQTDSSAAPVRMA